MCPRGKKNIFFKLREGKGIEQLTKKTRRQEETMNGHIKMYITFMNSSNEFSFSVEQQQLLAMGPICSTICSTMGNLMESNKDEVLGACCLQTVW